MNEFQQYYGQQFAPQQYGELAPQGFLGGLLGAPLGGLIGRGIGGLFGNPNLGRQIGQAAGGIGGGFLPFSVDPVAAAYAQQAQQQQLMQAQMGQLAPQGWLGNLVKSVAQPLGGAIGGAFGNAGLGNTIGGIAGQLGGLLPFGADPASQGMDSKHSRRSKLSYNNCNNYNSSSNCNNYSSCNNSSNCRIKACRRKAGSATSSKTLAVRWAA